MIHPFGMLMEGRKYSSNDSYRYGFNGKENDNEVKGEGNQQDYGMRIYDPRLGKFLSVDPLGSEYPWNSTYSFAENDPINFIDLDGAEKAKKEILKNIRIEVYNSKNEYDRVKNSNNTNQGQWHVITAHNIQSARDKLKNYLKGGKAENLVVSSHGFEGGLNLATTNTDNPKSVISSTDMKLYNERKAATEEEKAKMGQFANPDLEDDIQALYDVVGMVKTGGNFIATGCFAGQTEDGDRLGEYLSLNNKEAVIYLNQDFSAYFALYKGSLENKKFTGFVSVVGKDGTLTTKKDFKLGWKKFTYISEENKVAIKPDSTEKKVFNIQINIDRRKKPIVIVE